MYIPAVPRRWWRHTAVLSGGVVLVLALGAATGARAAITGGTWGPGQEVAGALNVGGNAWASSVSCPSVGNCGAGGYYNSKPGHQHMHAFVVNEVNGTWGTAQPVPEPVGEYDFDIMSVSCGSAGNCSAGGFYFTKSTSKFHNHAFVVDEVNGTWGKPEEVPGLAALDTGGGSTIAVSCASAGNCSAAGIYRDKHGHGQTFVVDEVHGTWHKAQTIPSLVALNKGGRAKPQSLSCGSAGNCTAAGFYVDGLLHGQAYVVNEVNGTWGKAEEVAAKLNAGGDAVIVSVSCVSAGNCSAGGGYTTLSGHGRAFVADEVHGTWGKAEKVPQVPGTGGVDSVQSVSCASAGNCSAVGSGGAHGFAVDEVNGTWGKPEELPGIVSPISVSCASAGNCSAAGFAEVQHIHAEAVVVNEVHGTWGTAEEVAAKLNAGKRAQVFSVSCAAVNHCSASGQYADKSGNVQAFVDNET